MSSGQQNMSGKETRATSGANSSTSKQPCLLHFFSLYAKLMCFQLDSFICIVARHAWCIHHLQHLSPKYLHFSKMLTVSLTPLDHFHIWLCKKTHSALQKDWLPGCQTPSSQRPTGGVWSDSCGWRVGRLEERRGSSHHVASVDERFLETARQIPAVSLCTNGPSIRETAGFRVCTPLLLLLFLLFLLLLFLLPPLWDRVLSLPPRTESLLPNLTCEFSKCVTLQLGVLLLTTNVFVYLLQEMLCLN